MDEREKHALRKERKSEEVLEKDERGLDMDKSTSHIRKDLYRAEDNAERKLGERRDKDSEV